MRRPPAAFSFLADSILPLNDGRLGGLHSKTQGKALVCGLQDLLRTLPSYLPIAVPDSIFRYVCPGDARTSAIRSLRVKECSAVQITQCQVSKVKIAHIPGACIGGPTIDNLPKKR